MTLQEALDKTLKTRGIKAVDLAASVGCVQSHISQIRKGHECTLAMLEKILAALERLSPGAKAYLCKEWLEVTITEGLPINADDAIAALASSSLTDEQLVSLLTIVSQRFREPKPAHTNQVPVSV
jgi:DNA-binding Xre family transcriptional regulator